MVESKVPRRRHASKLVTKSLQVTLTESQWKSLDRHRVIGETWEHYLLSVIKDALKRPQKGTVQWGSMQVGAQQEMRPDYDDEPF